MAFASRATSKRGIRDRLAITLWGRRGQAPTGPAFTAVTATETLDFSESADRSAQAFVRTVTETVSFAETAARGAQNQPRTATETLSYSELAATTAAVRVRTA